MGKDFEIKFNKVIERIILPKYDNIKHCDVETSRTKDGDKMHILYSVIYSMKISTTRDEIMSIKNDTRTMFRFMGPDSNETLQMKFYPRMLDQ